MFFDTKVNGGNQKRMPVGENVDMFWSALVKTAIEKRLAGHFFL
jgi:hypothetical protein